MSDPALISRTWSTLGPRLASVFHSAVTPLALLSLDHRFIEVNQAYVDMTGRTREACLGHHLFDVFPENEVLSEYAPAQRLVDSLKRVTISKLRDSMPVLRFDVADRPGEFSRRFWQVTNIPILDENLDVEMILIHAEEVTAFIENRVNPARLDSDDATTRLGVIANVFTAEVSRLDNLNSFASALVGATDPLEVGRAVCRDGLALAGASAGSLMLLDTDQFWIVASRGIHEETIVRWERFENDVGNDPFSDAIATGQPLFFEDAAALLDAYPMLRDEVEKNPQHRSWVTMPLNVGDYTSGAIGLIYDRPQQFSDRQRLILYSLANLTAQAASRAHLLDEQKKTVESVQRSLEPRIDPIPGVTITHAYRAATVTTQAGGDWYDIIDMADDVSLIVVGDVANHGTIAVGEMSRMRATVMSYGASTTRPAEAATLSDQLLSRIASTHATAIVARYDHVDRTLTWTNSGHPYPIVVDAAGVPTFLDGTHGAPLGCGLTKHYDQHQHQLEQGDTVVFYTDGLIERRGESMEDSFQRLALAIAETYSDDDVAGSLFAALLPDKQHRDDVAIVALQIDT